MAKKKTAKLSKAFYRKVTELAADLGVEPADLMQVMAFETVGSFDPARRAGNKKDGAVGLIQFTEETAKNLKTTKAALAKMSAEQQLDYVRLYFLGGTIDGEEREGIGEGNLEKIKASKEQLLDLYLGVLKPGPAMGLYDPDKKPGDRITPPAEDVSLGLTAAERKVNPVFGTGDITRKSVKEALTGSEHAAFGRTMWEQLEKEHGIPTPRVKRGGYDHPYLVERRHKDFVQAFPTPPTPVIRDESLAYFPPDELAAQPGSGFHFTPDSLYPPFKFPWDMGRVKEFASLANTLPDPVAGFVASFYNYLLPDEQTGMVAALRRGLRDAGYTDEYLPRPGDTYRGVAAAHDLSPRALREMNGWPAAATEEEDDKKLPKGLLTVMVGDLDLTGILNESLDSVKDLVEIAESYANGWVTSDGGIDWELADRLHPESEVVKAIQQADPERFESERHHLVGGEEGTYGSALYAPAGTLWNEGFESLAGKAQASAEILDHYRAYLTGKTFLSGSERRQFPDLNEDSSLLDDAFGVLAWPGRQMRGLLTGRPGEKVEGDELLTHYFGMDPNTGNLEEWDTSQGWFTQQNAVSAAKFAASMAADVATDPLTWFGGWLWRRGLKRAASEAKALAEAKFQKDGTRPFQPVVKQEAVKPEGAIGPVREVTHYKFEKGATVETGKRIGIVTGVKELGEDIQELTVTLSDKRIGKAITVRNTEAIPYEVKFGGQGWAAGDILPIPLSTGGIAVVKQVLRHDDGTRELVYDVWDDIEKIGIGKPVQADVLKPGMDVDSLLHRNDLADIPNADEMNAIAARVSKKNRKLDEHGAVVRDTRGRDVYTVDDHVDQVAKVRHAMDAEGVAEHDFVLQGAKGIEGLTEAVRVQLDRMNFARLRYWMLHKQYANFPNPGTLYHKAIGHEAQKALEILKDNTDAFYGVFMKESARSLREGRRVMAKEGRKIHNILKNAPRELSATAFARLFGKMDALQQQQAIRELNKATWTRYAFDKIYINSMLSAPSTHAMIIFSGQAFLAYSVLEHMLAGMIGSTMRRAGHLLKGKAPDPLDVRGGLYDGYAGGLAEGPRMLGSYLSTLTTVLSAGKAQGVSDGLLRAFGMPAMEGVPTGLASAKRYRKRFFERGGAGTQTLYGEATSWASAANTQATGKLAQATSVLSGLLQLPTIGISNIDSVMRWQAHEMFVRGHGWTQAIAKAKQLRADQLAKGKAWTRKEFRDSVTREYREVLMNPQTYKMVDAGSNPMTRKWARRRTLQMEADEYGAMISLANTIRDDVGVALHRFGDTLPGKLLFPFLSVAWRSFILTGERVPGLAHLSKLTQDKFRAGGQQRDMVLAKQAAGGLLGGLTVYWNLDGFFTGHGPVNVELQRKMSNTFLPNAFHWYNDETGEHHYFSPHRIDPTGRLMGLSATLAEAGGWIHPEDGRWQHLMNVLITALSENMGNPILADEMTMLARMVSNPDEASWEGIKRYFARKGTSFVPYSSAMRRYRRIDAEVQEMARGWMDEVHKTIPGWGTLPAWRNYWGEEVIVPRGVGYDTLDTLMDYISPFPMLVTHEGITKVMDDDVLNAFSREFYVPESMAMDYHGVALSKAWIARRRAIMGQEIRMNEYFEIVPPHKKGYTLREMYQLWVARDPSQVSDENPEGYNLKSPYGRAYASWKSTIPETESSEKIPGQRAKLLQRINQKYREAANEQFAREMFEVSNGEVDLNRAVNLKRRHRAVGLEHAQQAEMERITEEAAGLRSPESLGMTRADQERLRIGGRQ